MNTGDPTWDYLAWSLTLFVPGIVLFIGICIYRIWTSPFRQMKPKKKPKRAIQMKIE